MKQNEYGDQETLNNINVEFNCVETRSVSIRTNSYFEKANESQSIITIELENNSRSKKII